MTLQVNGERLWSSLMEMARIGGTEKGGCNRQALTDKDKQGRALFIRWCEEIGCTLRVDEMGNLFLRKAGRDNSLPPVRKIRWCLWCTGGVRSASHLA